MKEHTITVQFEVWDEPLDLNSREPLPIPRIGIFETVHVIFSNNQWHVTSSKPDTPRQWIGHGIYKNEAILNWLKTRLGLYPIDDLETT